MTTTPTYQSTYQFASEQPEEFWASVANELYWHKPWDKVLDSTNAPFYRWFAGAEFNTCYNCLDVHVAAGRGEQTALIYDSPVTQTIKKFSYQQLLELVSHFAGVLQQQGVVKGDRVVIYMPMVPEAVIAMLACARIGAIHSVVFGGFAARELATRVDDAQPVVVISASCGIEGERVIEYKPLLDEALEIATHSPHSTIILQRPQVVASMVAGRDVDWQEAIKTAPATEAVPVAATDPLYILYTSGTTGEPKGIVRDNGGHAVALKWSMKNVYDVEAGDVFWAASDVGWVVGHSYIAYGPLLQGCTTILYEGKPVGTPDPGAFWRVISEHKVKSFFTAPTAFRAIKKEDSEGEFLKPYDISSLKTLYLAGERCDPNTLEWSADLLKVPAIDHWWQTETGWPAASNCIGLETLPIKAGSPAKAVPGYDIQILDDAGNPTNANEIGNVVIKLPLPPGTVPTLWNNEARFLSAYLERYPGYYLTGDAGYLDEDDYLWVMSRIDDIINVAGHRLSTGAMEEVISDHPQVAECAVIGVADAMKGQLPLGLVVLKAGVEVGDAELAAELISMVRNRIGPVAAFKLVTVVNRLPKTRSGKVLRGSMKSIADGVEYRVPATIDDPVILDEIAGRLKLLGYPAETGNG